MRWDLRRKKQLESHMINVNGEGGEHAESVAVGEEGKEEEGKEEEGKDDKSLLIWLLNFLTYTKLFYNVTEIFISVL